MFSPISQLILLEVKSIEKVGGVLFSFFPQSLCNQKQYCIYENAFYEY